MNIKRHGTTMPNYRDGKIYAIHCLTSGDQYIGSTTKNTLAQRLSQHKYSYTGYCKGFAARRLTSHEIIEAGNYRIELIEAYPCESKDELHAREGHYIRTLECVNKVVPGRTKAEYYVDNKDKIAEHHKQYVVDNKDKIAEYIKQYHAANAGAIAERKSSHVTCECGCIVTKNNLAAHQKTAKHQRLLDKLSDEPILLQAIAHDI